MRCLGLVASLFVLLGAQSTLASAAAIRFNYVGNAFELNSVECADFTSGCVNDPDFAPPPPLRGTVVIDEEALGLELRNTTVAIAPSGFIAVGGTDVDTIQNVGEISFNNLLFLDGDDLAQGLEFTTDAERRIVDWSLNWFNLDDSETWFSGPGGDAFRLEAPSLNIANFTSTSPGSWQTQVVPLPAPIVLLLAGLASLGLYGGSRLKFRNVSNA